MLCQTTIRELVCRIGIPARRMPDDGQECPSYRNSGRRRAAIAAVLTWSLLVLLSNSTRAQSVWEYTSYDVRVWVALAPAPELTERLQQDVMLAVAQQSETVFAAAWDVKVTPASPKMHSDMIAAFDLITADEVAAADDSALRGDKLYLVVVDADPLGYVVRARELDCATRMWGRVIERRLRQPAQIPNESFLAVAEAFSPLARIEKSKDKIAVARLRAGGLIVRDESPALVSAEDILRPIVRNNDRLGEVRPGGIQPIPWTFLRVSSRRGAELECDIHSGLRNPISTRGGRRTENFALAVRPTDQPTELRLQARGTPSQPLAGYEIYSQDLQTGDAELLGQTDWRGTLSVPPADQRLRVLYVKNGGLLLARLPLVPGLEPQQTALVADDAQRLEAEGVVSSLQNNFMDTVARRQVLAVRIRKRIADKNLDEADKLLAEMRTLPTQNDFSRMLDQQRQRFNSADRNTLVKIDALFTDTRLAVSKYLDASLIEELARELVAAKKQSPATP
jgi:hypothetical protein